jgi:hypothetical protein
MKPRTEKVLPPDGDGSPLEWEKDALDWFAEERKLNPGLLQGWGVRAEGIDIVIPYRDSNGDLLLERKRLGKVVGKKRFHSPEGVKSRPYGLCRLEQFRNETTAYITEGETDTWAMWSASKLALGLPGSNVVNCLELEHLSGIETLYVCQDDDAGGKTFVEKLRGRLSAIGYAGKVFVLTMPLGIKDICALWTHDPDGFGMTLTDMEAEARELPCAEVKDEPSADNEPKAVGSAGNECPRLILDLTGCDTIKARPTRWLVKDLIPLGAITLLAGDGGCGKTTITLDLAARVSRGEAAWGLDYEPGIPAGVLLAGCEDSPHSTIVPLLLAAGADLPRIRLINGVRGVTSSFPFTLGSFDALAATLEGSPDIRLVVIDPVSAFLPSDVDDCQDASIRTLLRPLAELAEQFRVAIVLVRHLNKSESNNAGNLVGGNRGWVNASRAAFIFGRDPSPEGQEDERRHVLVQMKVNLSARMRGLAYRVESLTLGEQDDALRMPTFADLLAEEAKEMREQLRRVRWLGETDQTADDLAKARRGGRAEAAPNKAEACAAWLRTHLGKHSWPDKEVNAAREQAGFSFQAYKDAKVQLKAEGLEQRQRTGMGHPAPWWLGFGPESSRPDRPVSGVSGGTTPPDTPDTPD